MNIIRKIYDWMGKKVHSKYANLWLAALFFIEAIFFIPVDPLLILFCVENSKKSLKYATIATLSSVAGGVFAYGIGKLMWDTIGINLVKWIISESAFNAAILKYKLYQNWAVLIAGFTPLPYKAVTLSAGFCGLSLLPFIFYSIISRGARFFLVAGSIRIWGPQIKIFIDRYFNQLVILFTIILIASVWLLK
ncbi:DedA family protein [Candidatus Dependentiae bacterium]|nr:DedA family protein [Candidatus Dependentiae bacterium]MBU4386943.1 DedA family protein [Candidatus Dependentiae bacterium]MCG2756253.1 VTT domain-containing protein [Candidatus Dependentiae bacterium]